MNQTPPEDAVVADELAPALSAREMAFLRQQARRQGRHALGMSKYIRHQGAREKARRLKGASR